MSLNAQNQYKDKFKQRTDLMKANKGLQDTKVAKSSKKQAKQMTKEGWKVMPGLLTLEQQIDRASLLQNMFEDDLVTPQYVWGDATSTAENYDAGKMQALELARINMIGSIEQNITQLVEHNRDNKQLNAGNAASVIKSIAASKTYVSKNIGQTTNVVEAYRQLSNGNVEVRVMTFYSLDKAREIAKQGIRDQLEKQGENLGKELDELLGWRK